MLVPCPLDRIDELRTLLRTLQHDPARVVIVTTLPSAIGEADVAGVADHVLLYPKPGMLFSAWINTGLRFIEAHTGTQPAEVLCVGSDARGHARSVELLRDGLRDNGLVMAGPDWHNQCTGRPCVSYGAKDERTIWNRVPGSCFMLAAEHGLRMDEAFRWWYSDDDLEMQARAIGRVGLIDGTGFVHDTDHPLDAVQAAHAAEDRRLFVDKWGQEPW